MGFELKAGFWSMLDQGAVSAGNFLTAILLARALVPAEYGIYALLFALMLFVVSLHAALIVYGLSLDGAAGTDAMLRPLTGGSLVLTAGLGTVLGAAIGAVAMLFHRISLVPWILLAVLFWQLQETTRRALISRLRHRDAVWGDALSYLGQAACIAYLFVARRLSLVSAFEVMSLTSAAAWLFQISQLKLAFRDFRGALRLLQRFWGVGRWMLLTNIAQAFIDQALFWFLALRGTAEVASFQSIVNLVRAMNPVMFAIGSVLLPTVAAQRENPAAGLHAGRRYGLLGGLMLLPYFGMIFTFPGLALRFLYGPNSAYSGLGLELRLLVIASAFVYAAYVSGAYYNGLSKSYIVLRFQLVAAVTAVVPGFVLVTQAGVIGAALAYDLAFAAQTAAYVWFLRRSALSPSLEPLSIDPASQVEQP
ncbi:MAG TPA: polysaccharide biosynthesis C-terminal domain-containing protein [Candidatus Acidoferrum sp.]|nr:polysaccharide biosynthesis C-terminal domain-containing protein [Candidatus Acidoferrum sp.]